MILVSEDAALDFERLRNFLEINSPLAASHAVAAIWTAVQALDEFPHLRRRRGAKRLFSPFSSWAHRVVASHSSHAMQ